MQHAAAQLYTTLVLASVFLMVTQCLTSTQGYDRQNTTASNQGIAAFQGEL